MQTNGEYPPDERQRGDNQQQEEPEPEERVDLLVDYVQGHHAEGVVVLNGPGGAVLVEQALGHFREDHVQGVHLALEVVAQEIEAEGEELSAEEAMRRVDLEEEIEQAEQLARYQFGGKVPVHFNVLVDSQELPLYHAHFPVDADFRVQRVALVYDDVLPLSHILTDGNHLQAQCHRLDAALLQRAPEQVRGVEADGLQEQHKWHPLVVRVVLHLVVWTVQRTDAWMGNDALLQHCLVQVPDHGEGGGEEAERVYDMFKNRRMCSPMYCLQIQLTFI